MMEWREMGSEASAFPLAPRLRCDSPLILFGRHSLAAVCRKWRFPESLLGCGWTLNSPGASLKTLQPQQGIEIWSVGSNSYASHSYLIHSLAFDAMTSAGAGGGKHFIWSHNNSGWWQNWLCCRRLGLVAKRPNKLILESNKTKQKRCKLMEPNELSGQQNTVDFK